jgi:hypothetical protein
MNDGHAGGDDDARDHLVAADPGDPERDHRQAREQQQDAEAEQRRPGDRARVALGPPAGHQPSDAEADEHEARQRDDDPARDQRRGEQQRPGDEDEHDDAEDHEAAVALLAGDAAARGHLVLGRDEQDGGEVEQRAGAAEERQDDERDADDDRVDAEVAAHAARHAGDDAVAAQPDEPRRGRRRRRRLGGLGRKVSGHASSLSAQRPGDHREWSLGD